MRVSVRARKDSLESGERLEEADGFEGAVAPSEGHLPGRAAVTSWRNRSGPAAGSLSDARSTLAA